MRKFWYLVSYALKKRVKTKSFVIANIFISLAIIFVINLATIISAFGGDFSDVETVYVFNETTNESAFDYFTASHDEANSNTKFVLKVNYDSSAESIQGYLEEVSSYIVMFDGENGFEANIVGDDISLTNQIMYSSYLTYTKQMIFLETASPEVVSELQNFYTAPKINYVQASELTNNDKTLRTILGVASMFITLPIFIMLIMLMQFVGTDIIEEKSTRSIEIIISNVSPVQHFGSKILSSILFLLIQGAVMVVASLIGMGILLLTNQSITSLTSTGMSGSEAITSLVGGINISEADISGFISQIPFMIIMTVLFIIAGFLMYLIVTAVAAAMATNMEDYQQFFSPIMLLMLAGFYISIFGVMFDGATFIKICGYIPLISPLIAPNLIITGEYSIIEAIISLLILIGFDGLVIYFGIPIYRTSILSFSNEKFFQRIKKIIKASKDSK